MTESPLAIVGIGIVSPLGCTVEDYWRNLLAGNSGLYPAAEFGVAATRTNCAGRVRDFDPGLLMPSRFHRRLSRVSQFAVACGVQAVRDAGLELSEGVRDRTGVVYGTALGSTTSTDTFYCSFLKEGATGAQPIYFPETVPNAPASQLAIHLGITGPNTTVSQNHLSGEWALAFAGSFLDGRTTVCLAGGVDELSPVSFQCLNDLRLLKPLKVKEPLSADRIETGRGFIAGEGAVCLAVQPADAPGAVKENGPYAVVRSVRFANGPAPQGHYDETGHSLAEAVRESLSAAGLAPADVQCIVLGANGEERLEETERRALSEVFGPVWHDVPRVAPRYFTGEFGSAGLLSCSTGALALNHSTLPPSFRGGLLTGRPGSGRLAPAEPADLQNVLILGSTFSGGSCSMVLEKQAATTPARL